ncbi:Hypp1977 [Branchiostoma lanceolatum]|uniref:Hypp1977 protein n=1 Tax=Branchiostoma lanceolatum TaxID=7740 RepID=A0A8J9ZQE8_BRALA|nr:Hypp1977 [Branchiostoma lanceolatum]
MTAMSATRRSSKGFRVWLMIGARKTPKCIATGVFWGYQRHFAELSPQNLTTSVWTPGFDTEIYKDYEYLDLLGVL